jgi:hypothetical protein
MEGFSMTLGHTRHSSLGRVLPNDASDADYIEHLKAKCTVTESGCWECAGFQYKLRGVKSHNKGYVLFRYRRVTWQAHRISYTLHKGPIPEGMQVCHECDNPPCCNPNHLFLGTGSDNILDAVSKKRDRQTRKTHCPKGHEYDAEKTARNRRICTTCDRIRSRLRAGWPEHLALTLPPTPPGRRPVNPRAQS